MNRPLLLGVALALLGAATAPAVAEAPASGVTLEARLRHERVDDDAFSRDAEALVARARLGYRMVFNPTWTALAEAELTGHFGPDRFNDTANGRIAYPTVVDPDNAELNQAWVMFSPNASAQATLGRQRLNFGNQRFIGSVGWRANEQTFDALHVQHVFGAGPTLRYAWLDRVQRIFGDEHPLQNQARWNLDAHVLDATAKLGPGTLTAYAHYFDIHTVPLASHRNLGLRYALAGGTADARNWQLTGEFAWQRPHADGAERNSAEYQLIEAGLGVHGHLFLLGVEQLGGDGRYGFQTPFATLHAFNGWADRFLTTPVDGLQDRYLGWKHTFGAWQAAAFVHDFRADRGSSDYGNEWDASLGWAFAPKWNALFKIADYASDGFGSDVRKLWLQVEFKL